MMSRTSNTALRLARGAINMSSPRSMNMTNGVRLASTYNLDAMEGRHFLSIDELRLVHCIRIICVRFCFNLRASF